MEMQINVKGRVKNIKLAYSSCLKPLFEAVMNSIHAIDSRGNDDGYVCIEIERDLEQELLSSEIQRPVSGFRVIDNGIGFNDENFDSFRTSDSTFKEVLGGKGVGRFLWLKAFSGVEILSVYEKGDAKYKRELEFSTSIKGGIEPKDVVKTDEEVRTEIYLNKYYDKYQEKCPKDAQKIVERLIEHFLVYFTLDRRIPDLRVVDGDVEINLIDYFNKNFNEKIEKEEFEFKGQKFTLTILKFINPGSSTHRISFCADQREVSANKLSNFINVLPKRLSEGEKEFAILVYVEGEYLNYRVNEERTSFNQPEEGDLVDFISIPDLGYFVARRVEEKFKSYIDPIKEDNFKKVESVIKTQKPKYRVLLKHKESELQEISTELSADEVEMQLHGIYYQLEKEVKKKANEYVKSELKDVKHDDEYKAKFREFLNLVNSVGKSSLADYILHRKLILDLLDDRLGYKDEEEKFEAEEAIHELIFPLQSTSDHLTYDKQNLWLIDEKLSYHNYLASDMSLRSQENLENESRKEPDIIIFDPAFALSETDGDFSSIVIIEFKRPGRDGYQEKDNPILQVQKYMQAIRSGKIKNKKGRYITVSESLPFYCYIIADLTEKMDYFAKNHDFTKTPDSGGYFNYMRNYNAYVEIMSYDKLLKSASKRNKILFDKLMLPE
jgi:hypothetical protein